jgi:hypothetical protein
MSPMISSAQTALALLTGQSRTVPAAPPAGAKAAEAKRPPPPPPPQDGATAAQTPSAALAHSVFAALASNFDSDQNGTLSAHELGSTTKDDHTAQLFAAIESDGDGQMSVDDLDRFLKSVGEAIGASNGDPPADAPPRPMIADQPSASSAVSSLLEGLITAQANDGSVNNGKSTAEMIAQFTKLLAQTA